MATDWRAKHLLLAAGTLVLGLAIGGVGPRSEIRGLREQLVTSADEDCPDRDVGRELATVFRGRPWEPDAEEPEPAPAPDEEPVEDPEPVEVPEESLDAMRDAMDLRHTQARAALEQRAEPSEEQLTEIDAVVADMNAELKALATEAVAKFREAGGEPERRDLMVFAADTLDILIGAEEGLLNALDEDQRAELPDEALDPLSYVDPSIVDVLAELDRP